jgi:glutaredoxin
MYTPRFCGPCSDAKCLLRRKGVAIRKIPMKESEARVTT